MPAHVAATATERFDLAEKQPGYATACRHKPTLTTAPVRGAWIVLVAVVLLAVVMIGMILYAEHDLDETHRRLEERLAEPFVLQMPGGTKVPGLDLSTHSEPRKVTLPPRKGGPGYMLYALVPGVLVGIGMAVRSLAQARRFVAAPVRHVLAVVVDERVAVRTSGRASITQYHAMLHTRDGARREYLCEGQLAGRIAPNDIGVAFLKEDHLIDFVRLEA